MWQSSGWPSSSLHHYKAYWSVHCVRRCDEVMMSPHATCYHNGKCRSFKVAVFGPFQVLPDVIPLTQSWYTTTITAGLETTYNRGVLCYDRKSTKIGLKTYIEGIIYDSQLPAKYQVRHLAQHALPGWLTSRYCAWQPSRTLRGNRPLRGRLAWFPKSCSGWHQPDRSPIGGSAAERMNGGNFIHGHRVRRHWFDWCVRDQSPYSCLSKNFICTCLIL